MHIAIATPSSSSSLPFIFLLIFILIRDAKTSIGKGKAENVHAALLIYSELVVNSGEFMHPNLDEVYADVLKHRNSKDKFVKMTIVQLIPRLAKFYPTKFSTA